MQSADENELVAQRRGKVASLREQGIDPYSNNFRVEHVAADVYGDNPDPEAGAQEEKLYTIAGRIIARRSFGKAAFVQLQDRSGRLQLYVAKKELGEEMFDAFDSLDIGDIIGVTGSAFFTRTQELSLRVKNLQVLTKSLQPLPEKWHGLKDVETRYRQRYLDLIVNPEVKDVFVKRSQIISLMRTFMQERGYLEVETPMMQPVAGGATAKPFVTHHNTLKMDLFLRIAPELYLKRLVVGGLERVFEINRNFRNEGISIQHNPEFTMMEFYQAYANYHDLMDMTEEMICHITRQVCGSETITYGGREVNLKAPWERMSVREAIVKYGDISSEDLEDHARALAYARRLGLDFDDSIGHGKLLTEIFDAVAEPRLWNPTFITEYPTEVSPLSRRNDDNPEVVDRFELFIVGRELANAFSELNDPEDQRERFESQLAEKEAGDEEAHAMDEDYVRALEYGLPPTAGEGIGIDRLAMLLTDSASIRDVILFPQLRPESH